MSESASGKELQKTAERLEPISQSLTRAPSPPCAPGVPSSYSARDGRRSWPGRGNSCATDRLECAAFQLTAVSGKYGMRNMPLGSERSSRSVLVGCRAPRSTREPGATSSFPARLNAHQHSHACPVITHDPYGQGRPGGSRSASGAFTLKLIFAVLFPLAALQIHGNAQSFRGLGFRAGAVESRAFDVSGDGRVVIGTSGERAFRWTSETGVQPLGFLPGGQPLSSAAGTNQDGSVIVGYAGTFDSRRAFKWESSSGGIDVTGPSTLSRSWGVSGDGRVVVGESSKAFRWTQETGSLDLPSLGTGGGDVALAASHDGRILVGYSHDATLRPQAVIWADQNQPTRLPGMSGSYSIATAVSTGGEFVIGLDNFVGRQDAFVWSDANGKRELGYLPGTYRDSLPFGVSADGKTVVGQGRPEGPATAFIWTAEGGIRDVKSELENSGLNLSGWHLATAMAISDDGRTIIGSGYNPDGVQEAWIATIPEPSAVGLLCIGVAFLSINLRRLPWRLGSTAGGEFEITRYKAS